MNSNRTAYFFGKFTHLPLFDISEKMNPKTLGKIDAESCMVMICDLQEKFQPSILHFDTIVINATKIAKSAQLLNLPVLATEQYPKVFLEIFL